MLSPLKPTAVRYFTALRWYNSANEDGLNEDAALVRLAIAFEALLGLPSSEKTDRFVDAISPAPRADTAVDSWAKQFYGARSDVAHEGTTTRLRFAVATSKPEQALLYQSLLSYGRQIFGSAYRRCYTAWNSPSKRGLKPGLSPTKNDLEQICAILGNDAIDPRVRLGLASPLVVDIGTYRFVTESGLSVATILGAVRAMSKTRLAYGDVADENLRTCLKEPRPPSERAITSRS